MKSTIMSFSSLAKLCLLISLNGHLQCSDTFFTMSPDVVNVGQPLTMKCTPTVWPYYVTKMIIYRNRSTGTVEENTIVSANYYQGLGYARVKIDAARIKGAGGIKDKFISINYTAADGNDQGEYICNSSWGINVHGVNKFGNEIGKAELRVTGQAVFDFTLSGPAEGFVADARNIVTCKVNGLKVTQSSCQTSFGQVDLLLHTQDGRHFYVASASFPNCSSAWNSDNGRCVKGNEYGESIYEFMFTPLKSDLNDYKVYLTCGMECLLTTNPFTQLEIRPIPSVAGQAHNDFILQLQGPSDGFVAYEPNTVSCTVNASRLTSDMTCFRPVTTIQLQMFSDSSTNTDTLAMAAFPDCDPNWNENNGRCVSGIHGTGYYTYEFLFTPEDWQLNDINIHLKCNAMCYARPYPFSMQEINPLLTDQRMFDFIPYGPPQGFTAGAQNTVTCRVNAYKVSQASLCSVPVSTIQLQLVTLQGTYTVASAAFPACDSTWVNAGRCMSGEDGRGIYTYQFRFSPRQFQLNDDKVHLRCYAVCVHTWSENYPFNLLNIRPIPSVGS